MRKKPLGYKRLLQRLLFPLYRSNGLGCEVIEDTVDSFYLVGDSVSYLVENRIGYLLNRCAHSVGRIYGADDSGPAFITAFVLNPYALNVGNDYKILPYLTCKAVLVKFLAENSVSLSERVESVSCDSAEATDAKSGTGAPSLNNVD